MIRTMRWLYAVAFIAPMAACAGGEDAAIPQFAEQCDGECAEGLVCNMRICTTPCSGTGPTPACTALDSRAVCSGGYCYIGCSMGPCPSDLVCAMVGETQSTCRVP